VAFAYPVPAELGAELALLAAHAGDVLSCHDADGTCRYVSPSVEDVLGIEPDRLLGTRALRLVDADDAQLVRDAAEAARSGTAASVTHRVRGPDGTVAWLESRLSWAAPGDDEAARLVAVSRDVTARRESELELARKALHDGLTGLPNRTLFLDRLGHALRRGMRGGTGTIAVFFLDVDRFKLINDSLGHEAGDELLVDVAARLRRALRPGDTVARFGGDEFTVLCEDVAGELEAVAVAQRIVELFAEPFALGPSATSDAGEVFCSTSVGIALARPGRRDAAPEDLLRDADAAMYRAKERGRGRYELFDETLRAHAARRLTLETALRRAIHREELRVHYQPEIEVRPGGTGDVTGFEALVRWQHPERGLLAPGEFLALADETGLIVPIGAWVLREACEEAVRWRSGGLPVTMSVNLAARQLAQPDVVDLVARTLAETGLAPAALRLEIAESAVVDGVIAGTVGALKDLGVKLAIDDFGAGASSLAHLRDVPLDLVKLDRSFVRGLSSAPHDASIAQAVITLAHALGLRTVAEGIETADQLAVLGRLGCDLGQGFLFARPAPAAAASAALAGRRLAG
jgi:diguanylate cyclase (GGDEF)-like protein/PAS domain S-box-containing protein